MRICVDIELAREFNTSEIINFCDNFSENVGAKDVFYKYKDENGKTLMDYSRIGVRKFKARSLCYGDIGAAVMQNAQNRTKFNRDGVTIQSTEEYEKFRRMIWGFKYSTNSRLTGDTVNTLTQYKINGRFTVGMKTSRAFNRVCNIYGVDSLPNYNKMFAEYADMVSGLNRKLKFYISLNPLDYFTMSFGKSWSSCHTIDKTNQRGMPNSYSGMHCGGTMSYMLDTTSIITYVHTHETEDHEEGKLYRNMFHLSGGTLVQGRVYPQGNDGATDLYTIFRRCMQKELTKLLGLDADEWIKRNKSYGYNVSSWGVHYRDYDHFSGCNVSYPREMPIAADGVVHVGHSRICPKCGNEVSDDEDSGYLNHEDCDNVNTEDDEW
jgi:hypothetical protein